MRRPLPPAQPFSNLAVLLQEKGKDDSAGIVNTANVKSQFIMEAFISLIEALTLSSSFIYEITQNQTPFWSGQVVHINVRHTSSVWMYAKPQSQFFWQCVSGFVHGTKQLSIYLGSGSWEGRVWYTTEGMEGRHLLRGRRRQILQPPLKGASFQASP